MKIQVFLPIIFLITFLLCACQQTSTGRDYSRFPFSKPNTPRFVITYHKEQLVYWQWGENDSLHQGNIFQIDSVFDDYVSLYKYPQLEVRLRGDFSREEVNTFYEILDSLQMFQYLDDQL